MGFLRQGTAPECILAAIAPGACVCVCVGGMCATDQGKETNGPAKEAFIPTLWAQKIMSTGKPVSKGRKEGWLLGCWKLRLREKARREILAPPKCGLEGRMWKLIACFSVIFPRYASLP